MEEICTVEFLAVSLVHGDDALIAIEYLNLYMVICRTSWPYFGVKLSFVFALSNL